MEIISKTYLSTLAFIAERNSIVFRAGDSPIWNRNETILPMSWRLFSNTIKHPGSDFTLQTIPTLSSAIDFDLKKNQPDFEELLRVRMEQAALSASAAEAYKQAFQYDDDDIRRLDIDVYAGDVMDMVNAQMLRDKAGSAEAGFSDDDDDYWNTEENEAMIAETESRMAAKANRDKKLYAHNSIARSDLVNNVGTATHMFDDVFADVYKTLKGDFQNCSLFMVSPNDCLCSADGSQIFISQASAAGAEKLRAAATDPDSNVYADREISDTDLADFVSYEIHDEFYEYLASMDSWATICYGKFEEEVTKRVAG